MFPSQADPNSAHFGPDQPPSVPPTPTVQSLPDQPIIFGSFWVGTSEFALPVSAIREVVNEPDDVSIVPLAPEFLKGLFNLRGLAIPIVDLRALLELPPCAAGQSPLDTRKVAIVESGDKCVGILFDGAGEVLSKPTRAGIELRTGSEAGRGEVINGVLTLDNGDRMVQTIDPRELLAMDRVPQAVVADFRSKQKGNLGARRSCVSFQLGHTSCAIDLRFVQEVREMPEVDTSWLTFGPVIGSTTLRGEMIPVVDFRSFIGTEPVFSLGDEVLNVRKLLILQTDAGLVGLMVYSITSIIAFFENEVMPFAKLALPKPDLVQGCLMDDRDEVVMLLDHAKLMTDPGLTGPAKNCRDVQKVQNEEAGITEAEESESANLMKERKTFILFSLNGCFAMDTCHVIEVIDKPSNLLTPSYALDFVEGIINLRGELITLINLRLIYGLDARETARQKVLIFTVGTRKYAILVDSVDEIVMTTTDKVMPSYKTGGNGARRTAAEDVVSVLKCTRQGDVNSLAMIMDVGRLIERCERLSGSFV